MLTKIDIKSIIYECGKVATQGLVNGTTADIQSLFIDFLAPPNDFIGVHDNPAIFVSKITFNLLGKDHEKWVANKTIAVQETFLKNHPLMVIGIIAHEVGHAFNVAANIPNTEANACIFEIEAIRYLVNSYHPLIASYSKKDVQHYFESRLLNYKIIANQYLLTLIQKIAQGTILNNTNILTNASSLNIKSDSKYYLMKSPTLFTRKTTAYIFNDKIIQEQEASSKSKAFIT